MIAPLVLFAFNRPLHTKRLLESVAKSSIAKETTLIAYIDSPIEIKDLIPNQEVEKIIKNFLGFKSIVVIRRGCNFGLSKNIIGGITDVLNAWKSVIVLEDDLIVSPNFLEYMNDALNYYENKKNVWHISGYTEYFGSDDLDKSFFWRTMHCWGWATWADRWQFFEKNTDSLLEKFNPSMINNLNLDGAINFWDQVILNKKNKIDTWAIYWYATIFLNKGLCLNPYVSHVRNTGFDGSGTNCKEGNRKKLEHQLNQKGRFYPPKKIEENREVVAKLIEVFVNQRNISLPNKIIFKLVSMFRRVCQ
jgi:hypothetical protein